MAVVVILTLTVCIALVITAALYHVLVQQGRILERLEALESESKTARPGPRRWADNAPSLFIVSLPRSLSSAVYFNAQRALLLKESTNVAEGELLNGDRYTGYGIAGEQAWRRFARKELDPNTYYLSRLILDHVVQPTGHIYKDVVQPFVVADWLKDRDLHVLHLTRRLPDVAFAMLRRNWLYPGHGSGQQDDQELAFLEGLVLADTVLSRLAAARADYDDLIADEEVLWALLRRLYPARPLWRTPFIDEQFRMRRAETLARREMAEYKRLEERIAEVRLRLRPAVSPDATTLS
jgi:hypothetical protein